VGLEVFEGDEFEGMYVGGLEDDGRGFASLESFGPAGDAKAPVITGLESGKVEIRHRSGQVVAHGARKGKESLGHDCAYGVKASILRACATIAIAVKAGEGIGAACPERCSENVGWHRDNQSWEQVTLLRGFGKRCSDQVPQYVLWGGVSVGGGWVNSPDKGLS